jgi:cytidine deaminase
LPPFTVDSIADEHRQLLERARAAAATAYCPYSQFPVGAAVQTEGGEVVTGANVENASYGLSMCAERVAIFGAAASGHRRVTAIAVSCTKGDPSRTATLTPCGACRQVMSELMQPDAPVIIDGVGVFRLRDLLPLAFSLDVNERTRSSIG